ncbi:type III secretion system outer membrane ring subunit SctC [Citrobacter sp. U14242]|uniref:type III secretion system outer membrane ring subunit SctC n=1 Tax=Citrobacter sp. U14242 TaxID=3390192 RepID=UPI00397A3694
MCFRNKFANRKLSAILLLGLLNPVGDAIAVDKRVDDTVDPVSSIINDATAADSATQINSFTASNKSVDFVFKAISSQLKKPIIVSSRARKYSVTGRFDLNKPMGMIERITQDLGLIWYFDGAIYYIYEASEAKTAVVHFPARNYRDLENFLHENGMYDKRYPLKMNLSTSTLYISGPPKYIDIIVGIAGFMGNDYSSSNNELVVDAVKLRHVFVDDRSYTYRGQTKIIQGIASTINDLLSDTRIEGKSTIAVKKQDKFTQTADVASQGEPEFGVSAEVNNVGIGRYDETGIKVLPFTGRNSLLIKGTQEQINMVKDLIARLDIPRRQVEFSLWIIDVNKDDLDQIGVNWQGQYKIGSNIQSFFNATSILSSSESDTFLATVNALSQKDKANIVSRPIILAQDNIPAIFDNSRSFYVKLMGEREVSLQTVTYGTSINVIPMVSDDNKLVEMNVDITDGNTVSDNQGDTAMVDQLPVVGNTSISTMARVSAGQNLLIGGYTRDQLSDGVTKIPLLGDIPWIGGLFRTTTNNTSKAVRLFLIQPKILNDDFSSKESLNGYVNDGWDAIKSSLIKIPE